LAKQLVMAAKFAGADAVKFQTFTAENLVTDKAQLANYQKKSQGESNNQLSMLKKLELSPDDFVELIKFAREQQIIFLTTPHTADVIDYLSPHVAAYKISSSDFTNILLHNKLMATGKPLILSCGMTVSHEVDTIINRFNQAQYGQLALLQCTSSYPCPNSEVNLNIIDTFNQKFGDITIGFSDHTTSSEAGVAAIAKGAKIIEKHFTLSQKQAGPDHQASLEPDDLAEYINSIRQTEKMLGSADKRLTQSEVRTAAVGRKSLVAAHDLPAGKVIVETDLEAKRPAGGLDPLELNKILNKQLKFSVAKDEQINFDMFDKLELTTYNYPLPPGKESHL